MNAALRIYLAWHFILLHPAEILNAVFICRHKKASPGWGEAAPPDPPAHIKYVPSRRRAR
jgi:hypothetical protein